MPKSSFVPVVLKSPVGLKNEGKLMKFETRKLRAAVAGVIVTGVAAGLVMPTAAFAVAAPLPAGVAISGALMNLACRFSASSASALTLKWGRATFRQLA